MIENRVKTALSDGRPQIGLWTTLFTPFATEVVAATRYPPEGIRGVSALTRATQFGRVKGYFDVAAALIYGPR